MSVLERAWYWISEPLRRIPGVERFNAWANGVEARWQARAALRGDRG